MNLCPHCKKEIHITISQPHGLEAAVLNGGEVPLSHIISVVAAEFGLRPISIYGRSRERTISDARLAAYWFARKLTRLSLTELGLAMGGRDHGSVLSGSRSADALRSVDAWYREHMERIAAVLQAPGPSLTVIHSRVA